MEVFVSRKLTTASSQVYDWNSFKINIAGYKDSCWGLAGLTSYQVGLKISKRQRILFLTTLINNCGFSAFLYKETEVALQSRTMF